MDLILLHEAINKIAPIEGLSIGRYDANTFTSEVEDGKKENIVFVKDFQKGSDLRIDFAPVATQEQRELVQSLLPNLILASAKKVKISDLSTECEKTIYAGFTSVALGTPHHYNARPDNQMNLSILGLAGVGQDYTCTDLATGVKKQRFHTAEQIHQAFLDGLAHKAGQMKKFDQLRSLVESASTTEEVEAIGWQVS